MQLRISLLNILHLRDLLTEYEAKQIEFNRIWEISANIIKAVADPKKKAKLNLIRNKLGSSFKFFALSEILISQIIKMTLNV